jgi:hypothetical protein
VLIPNLYSFLAVNAPLPQAELLVVEGWLPDWNLKGALEEFQRGGYRLAIATGGPLAKGYFLSHYKTYAELTAATLVALGLDQERAIAVPSPLAERDRTVTSALALRDWLRQTQPPGTSLNLYTVGPHARRSHFLFQTALGDCARIGVIAAPPLAFDPDRWWNSSAGVRSVLSETIGYSYVRYVNWRS